MTRVLIIGHLCYDVNISGEQVLGGPANYQVPIFSAYGWDISIVTRTSSDYPRDQLQGCNLINIEVDHTTTFRYQKPTHEGVEDRIMIAERLAHGFNPQLVENHLAKIDGSFDLIIFSGIAGEIDGKLISKISSLYPNALKIMDLQSLTRQFDESGKMIIEPLEQSYLVELFSSLDIMKGSTVEIGQDFATSGVWGEIYSQILTSNGPPPVLIETTGSGKIRIYRDNITTLNLPTVSDEEISDSTGSGDIFLASLSHHLIQGKDLEDAILIAHTITSNHLQIEGIPTQEQSQKIINQFSE